MPAREEVVEAFEFTQLSTCIALPHSLTHSISKAIAIQSPGVPASSFVQEYGMDGDVLDLQKLTITIGRFRLSNPGRNIENLKSTISLTLQELEMTSTSANLEIPSTTSSIIVTETFPWRGGDVIGPGMMKRGGVVYYRSIHHPGSLSRASQPAKINSNNYSLAHPCQVRSFWKRTPS